MTPTGIAFYLLPGLWLAWLGGRLRTKLAHDGLAARIGVRLVQFSALGFAVRGLFVADPARAASLATRLHALGWSLWWIAFFAGAVLLGFATRQGRTFTATCLVASVLVPAIALAGPGWLGPRAAEWLANGAWAGWWAFALSRRPRAR